LLYHFSIEKADDELFFGMLLSTINIFAEQISNGGLSSFDLANKRYSFLEKNDIIFLGCSNTIMKEKVAKKELEEIIKIFFKLYPENICSIWNGNIKMFSIFKKEIEKMKK
jgi:hypothetical protein